MTTHYLSSPLQNAIYLGPEQELSGLNTIRHMLCRLLPRRSLKYKQYSLLLTNNNPTIHPTLTITALLRFNLKL
jgi:hypothetical protein